MESRKDEKSLPSSSMASSASSASLTQLYTQLHSLGQVIAPSVQKQIQKNLCSLLALGYTDGMEAPMTRPKLWTRTDLMHLIEKPYFVSEISVGMRYLALLVTNGCYLISEDFEMKLTPLFCPLRQDRIQQVGANNQVVVHHWTLLDGEMVAEQDAGKTNYVYLIYDVLALNGHPVMSLQLPDRLKIVQNDIIAPRRAAPMLPKGHPPELFRVALQSMYPVKRAAHILNNIIPRLSRDNVGLLFTPVSSPYIISDNKSLFLYRQQSHNTATFQIGVEWRGRPPIPGFKLMLRDNRTPTFYDWITFTQADHEYFCQDKKASQRLIECLYDPNWATFIPSHDKASWENGNSDFHHPQKGVGWRLGGWQFIRIQKGKHHPLEVSEMNCVQQCLKENILLKDFEEFFPDDPNKLAVVEQTTKRYVSKVDNLKRQSERENTIAAEKRKRLKTNEVLGVCYDFQNKGLCRRGDSCLFSHCACDTSCKCSSEENTFGQRPGPRSKAENKGTQNVEKLSTSQRSDNAFTKEGREKSEIGHRLSMDDSMVAVEEAGECSAEDAAIFEPLMNYDEVSIAARRAAFRRLQDQRLLRQARLLTGYSHCDIKKPKFAYTIASSGRVICSMPSSRSQNNLESQ